MLKLGTDVIEDENMYGETWVNPPEVDPTTGRYRKAVGSAAITESIKNLCDTAVGELVMNEDQGIESEDLLFENEVVVMDLLPLRFVEGLKRFEPRISRVTAQGKFDREKSIASVTVRYHERSSGRSNSTTIVPTPGGEG